MRLLYKPGNVVENKALSLRQMVKTACKNKMVKDSGQAAGRIVLCGPAANKFIVFNNSLLGVESPLHCPFRTNAHSINKQPKHECGLCPGQKVWCQDFTIFPDQCGLRAGVTLQARLK